MRITHPSGRESSRGAWPWRPKQALLPPAPHTHPGCPRRGSAAWAEMLWCLGHLVRTVFFVGSSPKLSKAPIWGRDSHTEPRHQARSHADALTVSPLPSSPSLSLPLGKPKVPNTNTERCFGSWFSLGTPSVPGRASRALRGACPKKCLLTASSRAAARVGDE